MSFDYSTINAYVTVYLPIAGWKSVLLTRDREMDNEFSPWETSFFAYKTREEAIRDAIAWGMAEEVHVIVDSEVLYRPDVLTEDKDGDRLAFDPERDCEESRETGKIRDDEDMLF